MNEPIAYFKGQFLPASQVSITVSDLGFVMGATFTEMTRTIGHRLFRAEDHISRLFASLRYGGIALPHSPQEVLEITRDVAIHNCKLLQPQHDLAVVQFATAGHNLMYAGTGSGLDLQPTFCVHTFPLPMEKWRPMFELGAHCVTPTIRHIPPACIDPRAKHRSRLHWWLAEREVHASDPAALSLLLDANGFITECAGANFLLLRGDTIFSPRSENILGGISRQTVRELSSELGYSWEEDDLTVEDVLAAEEAWLASTPYCIAPCTRLNGEKIGTGGTGSGYARVLEAWSKRVGVNIQAQILGASPATDLEVV